ncbi:Na+/H+ antiporter (plasmid) [Microvirga terrae]|uniref:Na+/H+ antiporter n=1 Tax=Microvirga terrae TaxID=2740529 RepID=A0ABY5S255_9HYPH|nr:Na+/H+ antiporter [Microvirga terrae]UVF22594.1 Na+/H+ antiporter [Microvirga terrae]
MTAAIQMAFLMLAVLVGVDILARRLSTASSIILLIAGGGLAFVPGLPRVELSPDLVLLGMLPPLIYSAAVAMSWREFRFNLRPIVLLALGCVVFTTGVVAATAHWLLGVPPAVAMTIGAIVAPPDAVAPIAIAKRVGLPHRLAVVLEGEGLANDATALILYHLAISAVSTGVFALSQAIETLALVLIIESAYGVAIGWLSLHVRRWAHNPRVEITLSLITPYVAFWPPAYFDGSGVLATVAAGLYISWNGPLLISSATRLQGIFFWDLVIYYLEGVIFLITGLQTQILLQQLSTLALWEIVAAVFGTTGVVIIARFVWVFSATYLPRWISPAVARRDPSPPWRYAFILAFIGVRGVVSLAAALAIPLTIASGAPFPHRDLVLVITFGVIIFTLVGQGLLLPSVVRWLKLPRDRAAEHRREHEAWLAAQSEALALAKRHLDRIADQGRIQPEVLATLRARHDYRTGGWVTRAAGHLDADDNANKLREELITAEREYIYRLLRDGKITDEVRRRMERDLDLEEAGIGRRYEGKPELPL